MACLFLSPSHTGHRNTEQKAGVGAHTRKPRDTAGSAFTGSSPGFTVGFPCRVCQSPEESVQASARAAASVQRRVEVPQSSPRHCPVPVTSWRGFLQESGGGRGSGQSLADFAGAGSWVSYPGVLS